MLLFIILCGKSYGKLETEIGKSTVVERVVRWRSSSQFVKGLRRRFVFPFPSTARYHTRVANA